LHAGSQPPEKIQNVDGKFKRYYNRTIEEARERAAERKRCKKALRDEEARWTANAWTYRPGYPQPGAPRQDIVVTSCSYYEEIDGGVMSRSQASLAQRRHWQETGIATIDATGNKRLRPVAHAKLRAEMKVAAVCAALHIDRRYCPSQEELEAFEHHPVVAALKFAVDSCTTIQNSCRQQRNARRWQWTLGLLKVQHLSVGLRVYLSWHSACTLILVSLFHGMMQTVS